MVNKKFCTVLSNDFFICIIYSHNLYTFSIVVHRTFSRNTVVNLNVYFHAPNQYTLHLCGSFHDFNACLARRHVVMTTLFKHCVDFRSVIICRLVRILTQFFVSH